MIANWLLYLVIPAVIIAIIGIRICVIAKYEKIGDAMVKYSIVAMFVIVILFTGLNVTNIINVIKDDIRKEAVCYSRSHKSRYDLRSGQSTIDGGKLWERTETGWIVTTIPCNLFGSESVTFVPHNWDE